MRKRAIVIFFLVAVDLALFYGALLGSLSARYVGFHDAPILIQRHILPFTIIFLLWLVIFGAFGLYDPRVMRNSKRFLRRLVRAMATNAVIAIIVLYFLLPAFAIEPRRNLFIITLAVTALIFLWRFLFNLLIIRAPASRIIFLGITKEAVELADFILKHPQLGYKPIAFVAIENGNASLQLPGISSNGQIPHYASHENLAKLIKEERADAVVILREVKENKILVRLLFDAIPLGVGVMEFPRFYEMLTGKIPLSLIGEIWFLENLVGIKRQLYEFFKRGLDILLALTLALVMLLFFPFVVLGIVLSTPGDIRNWRERRARPGDGILFFRQKRVGKNGRAFHFVKFRSQRLGAERMSEVKEVIADGRQYAFGRIMRKFYIDEIPQLWNILKGEMSFMGPRPERPEYVEKLKQKIPFYEMRLLVPPGITGWAQINMENDASVEDAPEKMQYDLYYIKNRSFMLDLLIALKTISIIVQRQGR